MSARILTRLRDRVAAGLFASRPYALTLGGSAPSGLTVGHQDPWPGDPAIANDLFRGVYAFGGQSLTTQGEAPWRLGLTSGGQEWSREAHAFGWLRHFAASPGEAARRQARGLIETWLDLFSDWHPVAWRPDILGRRLTWWSSHGPYLLNGAAEEFSARFLRSFARQTRHLNRAVFLAPAGLGGLRAVAGAVLASLAMGREGKDLDRAMGRVTREIERQILADGGHVSRSPEDLLKALEQLVVLRRALSGAQKDVPLQLQNAIDRIAPMLRFFRLGDGTLAQFNGGGANNADWIDKVLQESGAEGRAYTSAPHGGYQRLTAGDVTVVMDTGAAPPPPHDRRAHAGALAMEVSIGARRVIVNCGAALGGSPGRDGTDWQAVCRSTAAHSTTTVDDTSSARFGAAGHVRKGPGQVTSSRTQSGGMTCVDAQHDGYAGAFKLLVRRRLCLRDDGLHLSGEDVLERTGGGATLPFTVRFHLHPDIDASLVGNGDSALLRLADGEGWSFRAGGGTLSLAQSIYLGNPGRPRRTTQLVITGTTGTNGAQVEWSLSPVRSRTTPRA